jgi:hypothetical protein
MSKGENRVYPLYLFTAFARPMRFGAALMKSFPHMLNIRSIDLPGFGKSPLLQEALTIDSIAANIRMVRRT